MVATMADLPRTDSIAELAHFWDTHSLADFPDEFEVVTEPVFVRDGDAVLHLRLAAAEAAALQRAAEARGLRDAELVAEWVRERLAAA